MIGEWRTDSVLLVAEIWHMKKERISNFCYIAKVRLIFIIKNQ